MKGFSYLFIYAAITNVAAVVVCVAVKNSRRRKVAVLLSNG